MIEVAENGPGVPDDEVAAMFLPVFTTKPTGAGVGLNLARQIVLAHAGLLTNQPVPTRSALFRIVI